jgi:hypothetical protein
MPCPTRLTKEGNVMDKPMVYSPIPVFDQMTQYVSQMTPIDMGEYIFVGIEVRTASAVFDESLENLLLSEMEV